MGAKSYDGLQEHVRDLELPELETFENKYSDRNYEVRMEIPEFSCVCPLTGLPDFATVVIRYAPDRRCVELKSLKLYVTAFRDVGIFHEHVANRILDDFVRAVDPLSAQLEAVFNPRGGITTTVRVEHCREDPAKGS